jgi:hypothetical protein
MIIFEDKFLLFRRFLINILSVWRWSERLKKEFLIVRHLNFTYNKCYLFHTVDCSYLDHSFLYKWVVRIDLNSLNHIVDCLDRKLQTAVFASSTLHWVQIKVYLGKNQRFVPLHVKVRDTIFSRATLPRNVSGW